jgi:hypothetical protein
MRKNNGIPHATTVASIKYPITALILVLMLLFLRLEWYLWNNCLIYGQIMAIPWRKHFLARKGLALE